MKYYKIISRRIPFCMEYQFATNDSITKRELKRWFKKEYTPSFFVKVKEVTRDDIDIFWEIYLIKENGKIKCA